jgi:hypothetical protein
MFLANDYNSNVPLPITNTDHQVDQKVIDCLASNMQCVRPRATIN